MKWFKHKVLTRALTEDEFVAPDGTIGHLVENSETHLIMSVPHEMGATFYNFDKRTGHKSVRRIYITST